MEIIAHTFFHEETQGLMRFQVPIERWNRVDKVERTSRKKKQKAKRRNQRLSLFAFYSDIVESKSKNRCFADTSAVNSYVIPTRGVSLIRLVNLSRVCTAQSKPTRAHVAPCCAGLLTVVLSVGA